MKTYDRVCPYCKHMNRKLYLEETGGLMECEKCGEVSYVLLVQPGEIYDSRNWSIRKDRRYDRKPSSDVFAPIEMV